MLKGLLGGGFLAGAASAGAEAASAKSELAYADETARLARARADKVTSERDELRKRVERILDEFAEVTNGVNTFRAYDAGLRAVLRDLLAATREASPSHPFLDKDNRDRMYGAAFEAAFKAEPDRGWAPHVGNMKALESLVDAGTDALRQVAPGHRLLDFDEQALVYWESLGQEEAKMQKAADENNPNGVWLAECALEIGEAAHKSLQVCKFSMQAT